MAELITGRIYIIRSPNTEMVYIGSTTMTLKQRFQVHISDWKNKKERYCSSYFIIEEGRATINLLQQVEVENIRDLEIIEQEWLDRTPNTVNIRRAVGSVGGTVEYYKEYYNEHKEKYKKHFKEYYEKNKAKIAEKNKKKIQCTCGGFYTTPNKFNHKKTMKHIRNLEKSS